MKLASLKSGGRDGRLVVVSRDLQRAIAADDISPTMWHALENWPEVSDRLNVLASRLEEDLRLPGSFAFDPAQALAPLPRAAQWCDGSAYLNHAELVRKARGGEMPPVLYREPLLYQAPPTIFSRPPTILRSPKSLGASTSRRRSQSLPMTSPWAPHALKPATTSGS